MRSIAKFLTFLSAAVMALMVACGGSSSSPTPVAAPAITSFTADHSLIAQGSSALLTAVYTNGNGSVSPGVGAIPSNQPIAVSPSQTTSYVLTVTNSASETASRSLTITVVPPITGVSFTAAKTSIAVGESVALTATFSSGTGTVTNSVNATTVTPVSGVPFLVSPAVTTTYTLTVTNAAGATVTQGLIIVVQGAPTITSFTANPAIISLGGTSTLNYAFSGGSGAINNGVGPVFPGLTTAVTPPATTTYVLTVTSATGNTAVSGVTVTVAGVPSNISLTAERYTITVGESVRITATFATGTAVITNTLDASTINPITGVPVTVTPAGTVSYILTVTNAAGASFTSVATITVVPLPTITSFVGSPLTITRGNSTNLIGVFINGTGAISGIGPVLSGIPVRVSPTETTSYLLTVTNAAGAFVQLSTTIKVVEAPTGISLVAIPPIITIGNSTRLIGNFSSGTAVVDNGVGPVLNGVPYLVTPPVTTTYTMTVTNPAGASATTGTVVTVVPPPAITSFTSNPPTPPPVAGGSPVQLLPVFTNGSGYIGGVGSVISGNSYTVNPLETTTYTLTVTNPAGDFVTRILTVHVVGDPVIDSFIAFPSTITAGDFSQLIGIFSGGNGVITAPPSGSSPPFPGAGVPVVSGVSLFVNPIATTTYTLTVTNAALVSVNRSVTILVVGLPTATSLTASVNPITVGDTTMLTPTFAGGTGAITPSVGSVLSGSAYAVSPTQTTTYTLTVTNSIGASTGTVLTVVVLTGPNAAALVSAPPAISNGGTSYLTAYFTIGSGGTASVVCTSPNAATSGLAAPFAPLNAVPFPVTPTVAGTYVYTLTVTNGNGVTSTHGATVTVYDVPTAALVAASNTITIGETTSITPTFTNGTGVIAGIGTVTSGQAYPVSPTTTTTYVLTVTNPVGDTATASTTVTVLAGPFASAFYFQPNIITEGDTTQLYAIFSNATTAAITSNGGANLTPNAYAPVSGTPQAVVSAPASAGIYTYTLTVTNAALTTYTTTTNLLVVPAPTATLNVTSPAAFPYTITAGQSATLQPVFTNGTGVINNGVGTVVSGSSYVVTPTVSTTYTLTVTNPAGFQATASQTIFVVAGPFAQALMSDKLVATSGSTIYLTAVFTLPTSGAPTATVSSSVATDGALPNATPTLQTGVPFAVALDGADNSDRIFTLLADNGAGVTHTTGLLVKIVAAPTAVALATSAASISVGDSVTLTPTWTGGPDCVGVITGGGSSTNVVNGVGYSYSPIVTTTYVLTVTNGAGTTGTATQTIAVVQPPSITNFTAVPSVITLGDTTQLLTSYANATVSALTGPAGSFTGAELPAAPASGASTVVTPTAAGTYVYSFSVTGPGGTTAATTIVTVVAPPVCTVTGEAAVFASTTGHVASVPSQAGTTYSWNIVDGTITAGQGTNQITYTAGSTTGVGAINITCTVVNAAGSSCTTSPVFAVDVNAVPALTAALTTSAPADTISAGQTTNLLPVFGGGITPTGAINQGVGPVTSGSAYAVSPAVTTTYTLTVTSANGATLTAVRTITVLGAPSITSFTASPVTITAGTGITNLTGVFNLGDPGGTAVINGGNLAAAPATSGVPVPDTGLAVGTYTYTLSVTNSAALTVTSSTNVNVVAAPVATSLLANGVAADLTISSGSTATLQPNFSAGTGVISAGVGSVVSAANYAVTPAASTTYTLTVTNAAGDTATLTRTITVVSGALASSMTANPTTVTVSTPTDLTAVFSNGTGSVSGVGPGGFTYGPTAYTSGASQSVPVGAATGTYTFTLTVTGTGAFTGITDASKFVSVNAVAAPAFTGAFGGLSINGGVGPVTVAAGSTITLVPSFTGGTGAINQGVGAVISTQTYTTVANATTTYVLTVTNAAGASITVARTANVLQGPFGLNLYVNPTIVTSGDNVDVVPTFTIPGGGTGTLSGWFGVGVIGSGTLFTFPAPVVGAPTTEQITLTVVQAGTGVTQTIYAYVTVYPAPVATAMLMNGINGNITVNAGDTVTVQPSFSDGTGNVYTIGSVLSGQTYTVNPMATTNYILTVTNPAGSVVALNRQVTVLAGPFAQSLTLSPSVATSGDAYYFTPVFTLPNPGSADVTSVLMPPVNVLGGSGFPFGSFIAPGVGSPISFPFTLTVTSATGAVSTTTSSLLVYPTPVAQLNGAGFTSTTISAGASVPITVTSVFGSGVLSGYGAVSNGATILVQPSVTTNYVLTVTNPAGASASATFQITVIPAPGTASLTVNHAIVTNGTTVTFMPSWNPTTGVGTFNPGAIAATSGVPISLVPPATATTFYSLNVVSGANNSVAGVFVTSVPAATGSLTGTATITAGQSTNLTVGITSANTTGVLRTFGNVLNGTVVTVSPTATTTYFLDLTNAAGDTVTYTATVTVLQGPLAISLAASPQLITLGDPFQMTAVFSGTGGTVASADAGAAAPGAMTTGVPVSVTPTATGVMHYTLTATNGAVTATTGTFVNVIAAPVVTAFSGVDSGPNFPLFSSGDNITWTITYTDGGTNTNGVFTDQYMGSSATINSGQTVVTSVPNVLPGTILNYTLKVTNAAGTSVVQTVPILVSF